MARIVGSTYRITIPAPGPPFHDVVLELQLNLRDAFGRRMVTEAPDQLQHFVGRSDDYVQGYCKASGWRVEELSVWDPPLVPG